MPSELLHFPPAYTFVGAYRLLTDPTIRGPVLDKVKHASIRGLVVGLVYAVVSWSSIDWFIRRFLVGGSGSWFGLRKVREVVEGNESGRVRVMGMDLDLVFCTSQILSLRPAPWRTSIFPYSFQPEAMSCSMEACTDTQKIHIS